MGIQDAVEGSHILSNVDDDGEKLVQPIRVVRIIDSIEQPEFHRERNPVGKLDVLLELFLIFEPLEVQCQDVRKLLDLHPLFGFLKITTPVTEELVLLTQHFTGAKLAEASCHGRVLLDVDREV